jgi:transcriptional/translational regulatory protein YebC/TACO1
VLESGADDLILEDEESYEVICAPDAYIAVREYFDTKKIEPEESGIVLRPKVKSMVAGNDVLKVLKMLNALEELDDVQNVFSTFEASDEDMEAAMELL